MSLDKINPSHFFCATHLSGRKAMISGLQAMAVSMLTLFDDAIIEDVSVINNVRKVTSLIILGQVMSEV